MHLISKLPDKHYITHNPGQLEKSLFSRERKLQRLLLVPTHSITLQSCASTSEKVFSLFKIFLMRLEEINKKNTTWTLMI